MNRELLQVLTITGSGLIAIIFFGMCVRVLLFINNAFKYDDVSRKLSDLSWEMAAIGHWAHNEDFTDAEFRRMVKDTTRGREVVAR